MYIHVCPRIIHGSGETAHFFISTDVVRRHTRQENRRCSFVFHIYVHVLPAYRFFFIKKHALQTSATYAYCMEVEHTCIHNTCVLYTQHAYNLIKRQSHVHAHVMQTRTKKT
jgi:hypothetical protein